MGRWLVLLGAMLALACSSESTAGDSGAGGSAASGAGGATVGSGGALPCTAVSDCPAANSCGTYACLAGHCVGTFQPQGKVVPGKAVTGDCKQTVCDGMGNVTNIVDDTDVPDDGNPCTKDLCQNGMPTHQNANDGMPCGSAPLMYCMSGVCTGCKEASQCPQGTTCQTASCNKSGSTPGICVLQVDVGKVVSDVDPTDCTNAVCDELGNIVPGPVADGTTCGMNTFCAPWTCMATTCVQQSFTSSGTPTPTQTSGDCSVVVCDGSGSKITNPDPNDVPAAPGACSYYVCSGTMPVLKYRAAGTPCPGGTTGCDGQGHCI